MKKMSVPMQFDPYHGCVIGNDLMQEIKTSVKTILMTNVHERILLPEFGTRLQDYVFTQRNYTTLELIKKEVISSLQEQEPRINDIQVSFHTESSQDGILYVYVSYQVIQQHQSDTLSLQFNQEGVVM